MKVIIELKKGIYNKVDCHVALLLAMTAGSAMTGLFVMSSEVETSLEGLEGLEVFKFIEFCVHRLRPN